MGWYATEDWRRFLELFEGIYAEAVEFVNCEGEYVPSAEGWRGVHDLMDCFYEMTEIDPMPVWDLWRRVDRYRQYTLRRVADPDSDPLLIWPIPIAGIANDLQRVQMILERIRRIGVVSEKPVGRDGTDLGANNGNLFLGPVPQNPDIVDLVARIDAEPDKKRPLIDIAREFKGESAGNDKKAKSLLAQIRRLENQSRLKKLREQ